MFHYSLLPEKPGPPLQQSPAGAICEHVSKHLASRVLSVPVKWRVAVAVTDRRPLTTVAVGAVAVAVGTSAGTADVGEGWSVGTGTLGDIGAELEGIMAEAGRTGRAGEVGEGMAVGTRTPSLALSSPGEIQARHRRRGSATPHDLQKSR